MMTKTFWKNGVLLVLLVALIVGFHLFAVSTLNRYVTDLCQQGEHMIRLVEQEQYEEAIKEAKDMESKWERSGRKLCFFIDHEDVEEIRHMIAKVQSNFREETYALAVAELEDIMAKAEDMYQRERLTWENIF